jgi:hypothetical protein
MATPHVPLCQCFKSVYPIWAVTIDSCRTIPLSARSLIIKCCQAQGWPNPTLESSTLGDLMLRHPPVLLSMQHGIVVRPLLSLAGLFSWNLTDPLSSAILLDIMRALPLASDEIQLAKVASWNKEMVLVFKKGGPSLIRWHLFFDPDPSSAFVPIHDELPANPRHMADIRSRLYYFRRKYEKRRHTLYPRATHKNMSYDTRRDYEYRTKQTLEDVPIFGQDDWQRHYANTGELLQGVCEMRQKWYPSALKVPTLTLFALKDPLSNPIPHKRLSTILSLPPL